jgi:hypothetical protein
LSAIVIAGVGCAAILTDARFKGGIGFRTFLRAGGNSPLDVPAAAELKVTRFLGAPGGLSIPDAPVDFATGLALFNSAGGLTGAVVFLLELVLGTAFGGIFTLLSKN